MAELAIVSICMFYIGFKIGVAVMDYFLSEE